MLDGQGRPGDVDKLMDVCDNISPQITWPPKQTTICPLGPSAVSPIASAISRFRSEFEAYIGAPAPVTVPMGGKAYTAAPEPEAAHG
jgi:NADH-quinone oxidoreductase subunit F